MGLTVAGVGPSFAGGHGGASFTSTVGGMSYVGGGPRGASAAAVHSTSEVVSEVPFFTGMGRVHVCAGVCMYVRACVCMCACVPL